MFLVQTFWTPPFLRGENNDGDGTFFESHVLSILPLSLFGDTPTGGAVLDRCVPLLEFLDSCGAVLDRCVFCAVLPVQLSSCSAARMRRLKSKYFLALSCFSIPKSKKERIQAAENQERLWRCTKSAWLFELLAGYV